MPKTSPTLDRYERKRYTYPGSRIPSVILYPDSKEALVIVERYWKGVMGRRYSFAEVQRHLLIKEAAEIKRTENMEKEVSAK